MTPSILLVLLLLCTLAHAQEPELSEACSVSTSSSQIVLRLVESQGEQTDQLTMPEELPIAGVPGTDMELELVPLSSPSSLSSSISRDYTSHFYLDGKKLRLSKPLDRDEHDLASIHLQVRCTQLASGRRKSVPVVVAVMDINDSVPEFTQNNLMVLVPENTDVNTTVFKGLRATDKDANVNGQVEFRIGDSDSILRIDLPHQGEVKLNRQLDYEQQTEHLVTIVASDRALDKDQRLSSTATLVVRVVDSDDLGPEFDHELYSAEVYSGSQTELGALEVSPEHIRAVDGDSLRAHIVYSVEEGFPDFYADHFRLNEDTGALVFTQYIDKDSLVADTFNLTIRATERTSLRRSTTATLLIRVRSEDLAPPVVAVSSDLGLVKENSEAGTVVTDTNGNPITFDVSDNDLSPELLAGKQYEFVSTSTFFSVNDQRVLVVSDAVNNGNALDRDPPNQPSLHFQVFAREAFGDLKSSAPVSVSVRLTDENDNAPVLRDLPDVIVPAGSSIRTIAKLEANDVDENSKLSFSLVSVAPAWGRNRFRVDSKTGDVELVSAVSNGDRFSLTLRVEDQDQLFSQAILEVRVTGTPNLRGPVFSQYRYLADVSENAAKFASVVHTRARDHEGDVNIRYSLVDGNQLEHFSIEESTGVVRVAQPLDREAMDSYTLTVRAEDSGGKFGTAVVSIRVLDVNDHSPVFIDEPYSFRVDEGRVGVPVGQVKAEDEDEGENAMVHFSIKSNISEPKFFAIDELSGKISTASALDFELQSVHYVIIEAYNDKNDLNTNLGLVSSATATVLVQDVPDEVPFFPDTEYKAAVAEDLPVGSPIVSVLAMDMDSSTSITYRLLQGDQNLFQVDGVSGNVSLKSSLDFERKRSHVLVVGTDEALAIGSDLEGSSCTVTIDVIDVNDQRPRFGYVPNVVYVGNDVEVGHLVAELKASDDDGTEPNNVVNFEIVDNEENLFGIDGNTGRIFVNADLSNELGNQYRLLVRAFDLGTPSLDVTASLTVQLEHVITLPPSEAIGFEMDEHKFEVNEDEETGNVLGLIKVGHKLDLQKGLRVKCRVQRVFDAKNQSLTQKMFETRVTDEGHCELVLSSPLDFESNPKFNLELELDALAAFVDSDRQHALIRLDVINVNDHVPSFVYSDPHVKDQYLVALPLNYLQMDLKQDTVLVHDVEAIDEDDGVYGQLVYSVQVVGDEDDELVDVFSVDKTSGRVTANRQALAKASESRDSPFELSVVVSDGEHSVRTMLTLNILRLEDSLVLRIADVPVDILRERKKELMHVLQALASDELVVRIDTMAESRLLYPNNTCCYIDKNSTDIYFHLLEANSYKALSFDDELVQRHLTSKNASDSLKYAVAGRLELQAQQLHPSFVNMAVPMVDADPTEIDEDEDETKVNLAAVDGDGWPILLIIGAIILAIVAFLLALHLCLLSRKLGVVVEEESYSKTIVIPRYEPVFVEPVANSVLSTKEYETQQLQMAVNTRDVNTADINDDDISDDFDDALTKEISLDSISYITHNKALNDSQDNSLNFGLARLTSSGTNSEVVFGSNFAKTSTPMAKSQFAKSGRNRGDTTQL